MKNMFRININLISFTHGSHNWVPGCWILPGAWPDKQMAWQINKLSTAAELLLRRKPVFREGIAKICCCLHLYAGLSAWDAPAWRAPWGFRLE